jgi:cell division protease FtsH
MKKLLEGLQSIRLPLLVAALLGLSFVFTKFSAPPPRHVSYTELGSMIDQEKVDKADVRPDEVRATLKGEGGKPGETVVADRVPNVDERSLLDQMEKKHVVITGSPDRSSWWSSVLWTVAPWILISMLLWGLSRAASTAMAKGGKPLTFGKSNAAIYDRSKENPVTFADVAGVDEAKAELVEVVKFLREPTRYRDVGARVPKGVLLVGAPGTGKTMLAKAVAGESGVPFFSISGSEFVEMFVGVGASRVRDLFEQAKQRAPCIIFIDELDAVGKARSGAGGFVANEEREQTLNQLLVEMDGFDSGGGLIVMAATNRPEILDRALLRSGRFDRQVLVDRPDVRGREAILRVHTKKIKMGVDVDLKIVAQRTPGMVGSDLANAVNEAALACVRRGGEKVTEQDFEEAIDRIQLGLKKEGRVMSEQEKLRVAFHESGHALVATSMEHADPVHRVTIIPRSVGALGATLQLPIEEHYMMTREELRDRICVLLGGRSAEELACKDVSTGAEDDFEKASELARLMVCRFGMSDLLGPQTFGPRDGGQYLPWAHDGESKHFSEETARIIDREIKKILTHEHERALSVLSKRRNALDTVAHTLLTKETLQGPDLDAILGTRPTAPVRAAS